MGRGFAEAIVLPIYRVQSEKVSLFDCKQCCGQIKVGIHVPEMRKSVFATCDGVNCGAIVAIPSTVPLDINVDDMMIHVPRIDDVREQLRFRDGKLLLNVASVELMSGQHCQIAHVHSNVKVVNHIHTAPVRLEYLFLRKAS